MFRTSFNINSILFLGCCFFILNTYAQNKPVYKLDTIHYIKNVQAGRHVNQYIRYYTDESGFTCLYRVKKNLCLESFSFSRGKRKLVKVNHRAFNSIPINTTTSFTFTNDTLVLVSDTSIIGYALRTKKVFLRKTINKIEYSRFYDQTIFYGRYYNFHPLSKVNNACVYTYHIPGGRLDSIILRSDFMEYTHYLPSQLISFQSNSFIYPSLGSYKIFITNKHLHKVDSVEKQISNWASPSKELHAIVSKNPDNLNTYFPLLDKENFERISRIELLEYMDTNTFLVRWFRYDTTLHQRLRTIDIWSKKNKAQFTLDTSFPETSYPIYMDSLISMYGLPLRSENFYTHYTKNHIVQIKSELALNPKTFTTYREYLVNREKQGKTNEPIVSIWIFKKI